MMNSAAKTIVLTGFVVLTAAGMGIAVAQVPNLPIPAMPGSTAATPSPVNPTAPAPISSVAPASATPNAPAAPDASNVKVAGVTQVPTAAAKVTTPPLPNESADKTPSMNAPALNGPSNAPKAATPTVSADEEANPNEFPALPMPQAPSANNIAGGDAPSIPLLHPYAEAPKPKVVEKPKPTWLTKLAPQVIPPRLGYNYRRETLPNMVYRKEYDGYNQHLPTQVTREDYQRLLLKSVANNDVDATRALLHEGVPPTQMNANGESALVIAHRYGASDTARLLVAWGAQ